MDLLIVLGLLVLLIGFAYCLWRASVALDGEDGGRVDGGGDPLMPPMSELPPFKGKELRVSDEPDSYEKLGALLAAYIVATIELEKKLGLTRNQVFRVENDDGASLQDIRYRAFILDILILQGKVNTADLYGENAACGSRYFYPDIFAFSCEALEKDIAQIDV